MSSANAWEASEQLGSFQQDISVRYNLDTLNEDSSTRLKPGMSHLKFGRYPGSDEIAPYRQLVDFNMQHLKLLFMILVHAHYLSGEDIPSSLRQLTFPVMHPRQSRGLEFVSRSKRPKHSA